MPGDSTNKSAKITIFTSQALENSRETNRNPEKTEINREKQIENEKSAREERDHRIGRENGGGEEATGGEVGEELGSADIGRLI